MATKLRNPRRKYLISLRLPSIEGYEIGVTGALSKSSMGLGRARVIQSVSRGGISMLKFICSWPCGGLWRFEIPSSQVTCLDKIHTMNPWKMDPRPIQFVTGAFSMLPFIPHDNVRQIIDNAVEHSSQESNVGHPGKLFAHFFFELLCSFLICVGAVRKFNNFASTPTPVHGCQGLHDVHAPLRTSAHHNRTLQPKFAETLHNMGKVAQGHEKN